LAFANDTLYVTDNETGLIHELDPSGKTMRILNPQLAPGELAGIAIGPDQRLYVTNLADGSVSRVEAP
jgi:streptogramin lyase